jgi:hypothetical protein
VCPSYNDEMACTADTDNACVWYALGIPCQIGEPCRSGVCQQRTDSNGSDGGGCACACPDCSPGASCPPCDCTCGEPTDGGTCTPPAPPPGPVCPAIGCYPQCPNGVLQDEDGCDTCACR